MSEWMGKWPWELLSRLLVRTVGRSNGLVPETQCLSPRRERTCRWDGRQGEAAGALERLRSKHFGLSHSLSSNLSQPTVWIQPEITNKPVGRPCVHPGCATPAGAPGSTSMPTHANLGGVRSALPLPERFGLPADTSWLLAASPLLFHPTSNSASRQHDCSLSIM